MNIPIPTGIACRTAAGIASKIFLRSPVAVRMMNTTPSSKVNIMQFAYVRPLPPATRISENTINALTPMPEACARGIFARNAMSMVPATAPIAVAIYAAP